MNLRRFDTLFVRLFVLMWVALVVSHLAAFYLSVPLGESDTTQALRRRADAPLPPLRSLPPGALEPSPREGPPPREGGPPPGLPPHTLWLDYALRMAVIALAAWWGSLWLSRPTRQLAGAAVALADGIADRGAAPSLDERHGTVEVRETARVFNRMARRLREQFDARSLQMAAISHDLRTPLTRLRLQLERSPDHPAAVGHAIDTVREMDEMIHNHLAVLREQRDDTAAQPVDVAALLQSMADDLAETGRTLDIAALEAAAAAPRPRVRAHPAALRRIVGNLVDNALRHGGSGRVSVRRRGDTLAIHVDDDGPGIAPERLQQAFEPWVQLSSGPGHGLGLAIARELAAREGGTIVLANRAEGGLRATLTLPSA